MSPLDARMTLLLEELRRDWGAVGEQLRRARDVEPGKGSLEAAFVALALDHAYQALETMLVRLERALGLPERTGGAWHAAILADATMPLGRLRPEVLPAATLRDWEALRRFRHFLRHAYAVELDAEQLATNVQHLERAVAASEPSVQELVAKLAAGVDA